jgi:glycerol-3-phosphate dehydrogenase (NAD(P)+)
MQHIEPFKSVAVVGGGAWGTALAIKACKNCADVLVYDRRESLVEGINKNHKNDVVLPGVQLPQNLRATNDVNKVAQYENIIIVIPAQAVGSFLDGLRSAGVSSECKILLCSKGIDNDTLQLQSEIARKQLPNATVAVLSGPNFAHEVAMDNLSAATVACEDEAVGRRFMASIASRTFRVYFSKDIIGVQIVGALKNVIAIASGIVDGLNLGENAKSALITRGMKDIATMVEKLGGNTKTLLTLAGIGDVMLTCGSTTSRNMNLGCRLGQGEKLADIIAENITVEGYSTSKAVYKMAKDLDLELPVVEAVYQVLHNHKPVADVMNDLLDRPLLQSGEEI